MNTTHHQVVERNIASLRPYSGNARTHSNNQIKQIAASISRFGFNNPVLVSDAGEIIAGHGRVQAAQSLGWRTVPTIALAHLSEAERRAYVIADNKLALNAGWDREILAIELQALVDLEFDVELTGFSLAEIDIVLDDASEADPNAGDAPEDAVHLLDGSRSAGAETHPWRRCTLDSFVAAKDAVFEAKHVSAFANQEEVLERYMPQLQHNTAVMGGSQALLSVIYGNHKWEVYEVGSDWLYQEELLIAEARFWDCVRTGERPVPAPLPLPPKPVGTREVCFEGNNAWAAAAGDWLDNRQAAKRHGTAVTTLRSLVEDDVSRALGHGLEIRRSKAGALSIRELAL